MKPRLIIAGGSGFLGTVLAEYFAAGGHESVILTRQPKPHTDNVWNSVICGILSLWRTR